MWGREVSVVSRAEGKSGQAGTGKVTGLRWRRLHIVQHMSHQAALVQLGSRDLGV